MICDRLCDKHRCVESLINQVIDAHKIVGFVTKPVPKW